MTWAVTANQQRPTSLVASWEPATDAAASDKVACNVMSLYLGGGGLQPGWRAALVGQSRGAHALALQMRKNCTQDNNSQQYIVLPLPVPDQIQNQAGLQANLRTG